MSRTTLGGSGEASGNAWSHQTGVLSFSGHELLMKYQTSVELQYQRSQHRTFACFLYCVITFCRLVNSEQSAMEEKGPM